MPKKEAAEKADKIDAAVIAGDLRMLDAQIRDAETLALQAGKLDEFRHHVNLKGSSLLVQAPRASAWLRSKL